MNILALDCATKTGWAGIFEGEIDSGVENFKKKKDETNGDLFAKFDNWLFEQMRLYCFLDVIVYEETFYRGAWDVKIGAGLVAIVQLNACQLDIEIKTVHTGSLKKWVTGKGNASKQDMMDAFEVKTGRKPIDDNEADAYWILMWAMNEYNVKEEVK